MLLGISIVLVILGILGIIGIAVYLGGKKPESLRSDWDIKQNKIYRWDGTRFGKAPSNGPRNGVLIAPVAGSSSPMGQIPWAPMSEFDIFGSQRWQGHSSLSSQENP